MNTPSTKNQGYTLIELMLVILVLTILVSVAIPGLIRARMQSNEATAQSNLRIIVGAQTTYFGSNSEYADNFAALVGANPPYLDQSWAEAVTKNGYTYAMESAEPYQDYALTANRHSRFSGARSFFTDSTGIIRYVMGDGPADADSTPIGEAVDD